VPWHVGSKTSKGWSIIKTNTGKVVGYSTTKAKAEASIRARYKEWKWKD